MTNNVTEELNTPSKEVSGETGFLRVRHDRITRFLEQPRTFFSEVSIQELATSIETEGQNTPVQLCKGSGGKKSLPVLDERGNVMFTLIDGERRWRACTLIAKKTGKPFLLKATIEIVADVEEHFRRSFGANFGTEEMTPLDVAAGLKRLKDNGATLEQLAKSYGKSPKYVFDYLSLNNLNDKVKVMMDPLIPKSHRLRVSHAVQIARVKKTSLQVLLAEECLELGLSTQDLRMSVDGKGLGNRTFTQSHDPNLYKARKRKVSDERAVLTNLLQRTDKSLKNFVGRIKNRNVDFDDIYMSCINADEVFEKYLELLSSMSKSILVIQQEVKNSHEN